MEYTELFVIGYETLIGEICRALSCLFPALLMCFVLLRVISKDARSRAEAIKLLEGAVLPVCVFPVLLDGVTFEGVRQSPLLCSS